MYGRTMGLFHGQRVQGGRRQLTRVPLATGQCPINSYVMKTGPCDSGRGLLAACTGYGSGATSTNPWPTGSRRSPPTDTRPTRDRSVSHLHTAVYVYGLIRMHGFSSWPTGSRRSPPRPTDPHPTRDRLVLY
ncbi:uncharacterized protein LOC114360873 [Ostrinia furnacalis]|uniref:uncharacterized protein LOC114360873 n=1 Tax=Ostrinia furnacalis TaxID=93504 RepID=UPI0010400BEC|nr:uncharacterized protein LOC114360873 [Ostrinia furnacalis]